MHMHIVSLYIYCIVGMFASVNIWVIAKSKVLSKKVRQMDIDSAIIILIIIR